MGEDLQRLAASLLWIGFGGLDLSPDVNSMLRKGIGGVILFRRNVEGPQQVASLIQALQAQRLGEAPLVVAVDQEGGRVARVRAPATEFPDACWLGRTGDEALATRFGQVLARELTALGFNLDFAPVMDVDSNPANPVIGPRAFSSQPEEVARMGVAVIRGMQGAGLLACAKHFPGHGDTVSDSHLELPELPHGMDRLRAVELVPFQAAISAGVATLMTAHVRFTALDSSLPATLSRPVIQGLLREELGYGGVVVSDDLEMRAIADHYGVGEAARLSLEAGVDAFLVCHRRDRQEEALEALVKAAESRQATRERLREAAGRVAILRAQLPAGGLSEHVRLETFLGCEAHRAVADEIRRRGAPVGDAREVQTEVMFT